MVMATSEARNPATGHTVTRVVLPAALVLQALLVASPIATIDNLLTSPRAVGAQARRADLAATIASGIPFLAALLPVAMVAIAIAVRRPTRGSLTGAGVVSVISLVAAAVPRLREMTLAPPVLHGIPLALVALATLVLMARTRTRTRRSAEAGPSRSADAGRSRIGRITAALAAVWLLVLAGIGALSSTIPTAPISAAVSEDLEFTSAEPSARIPAEEASQAPFLAPNPTSNIHGDAAMTDAYTDRTVLDPREAEVISRHLGGVCASILFDSRGNLVAACVNPTGVTLNVLDPETLDVRARRHVADRPFRIDFATQFAGGGYAVLDSEERVVLPTADGRITRWSITGTDGTPQIAPVDEFDVSGELADGEAINSAVPGTEGSIWLVGTLGSVALLDPETGTVGSTRFDGTIENSFAVGSDGLAHVVTDRELVALRAADGVPEVVWTEPYDRGSRQKPGQTSRGSGTTPTLVQGGRYVAITDNADPRMHVLVYDTAADAGEREVCRVPVFAEGRSATENSLIAIGGSLFVESNYGYSLYDATYGRSTEPGLTRIDITAGGCEVAWANDEIRIPSVVSKGTSSGVIVTYTKGVSLAGIDAWYFTAVDATTGEVMWRRLAGTGPMVNNHYAAIYLGTDGSLYVGATGGVVALVPDGGD